MLYLDNVKVENWLVENLTFELGRDPKLYVKRFERDNRESKVVFLCHNNLKDCRDDISNLYISFP